MLGVKLGDEMVKAVAKLEDLKVVGLEHNALVIDCGNGRIRLIALSDLVDLEEAEREEARRKRKEEFEEICRNWDD